MARNFGLQKQIGGRRQESFWPLIPIMFIVIGVINVAAHLR